MAGYLPNESDVEKLRELIARNPMQRTRGLANRRRPRFRGGGKAQGQIYGYTTKEIVPDEDIAIDNITLLWGKMPPDVEEETSGSPGEFTLTNLFKSFYPRGALIVGFETKDTTPTQIEQPGHSNDDAISHAASDAVSDHADEEAVGEDSGGGAEWWGFNPNYQNFVAVTDGGGVPASTFDGSTITPGSGTVTLYWPLDPENSNAFSSTLTVPVQNVFKNNAVAANTIVTLGIVNGLLVVNGEDCP